MTRGSGKNKSDYCRMNSNSAAHFYSKLTSTGFDHKQLASKWSSSHNEMTENVEMKAKWMAVEASSKKTWTLPLSMSSPKSQRVCHTVIKYLEAPGRATLNIASKTKNGMDNFYILSFCKPHQKLENCEL